MSNQDRMIVMARELLNQTLASTGPRVIVGSVAPSWFGARKVK